MKYKAGDIVFHSGHGYGVVVEVRTKQEKPLDISSPEKALMVAIVANALRTTDMFYGPDEYPYKVHFKPTTKYPKGYMDVYAERELHCGKSPFLRTVKDTEDRGTCRLELLSCGHLLSVNDKYTPVRPCTECFT